MVGVKIRDGAGVRARGNSRNGDRSGSGVEISGSERGVEIRRRGRGVETGCRPAITGGLLKWILNSNQWAGVA